MGGAGLGRECPDGEGVASAGEALTLSGRLVPGTARAGRERPEWKVRPRSTPSSPAWPWPRASSSLLPSRSLWLCLSLCLPVAVPSPRLVRTQGVGEGYSCPQARVEVRVDREPPPGPGEQVCAGRRDWRRGGGGGRRGEDGRGISAGPVVSGVWAELCLPLTVCLCVFREAGTESVGIGEGFLGDSRSPPPPPDPESDPEGGLCTGGGWGAGWGWGDSQAPGSRVGTGIGGCWRECVCV